MSLQAPQTKDNRRSSIGGNNEVPTRTYDPLNKTSLDVQAKPAPRARSASVAEPVADFPSWDDAKTNLSGLFDLFKDTGLQPQPQPQPVQSSNGQLKRHDSDVEFGIDLSAPDPVVEQPKPEKKKKPKTKKAVGDKEGTAATDKTKSSTSSTSSTKSSTSSTASTKSSTSSSSSSRRSSTGGSTGSSSSSSSSTSRRSSTGSSTGGSTGSSTASSVTGTGRRRSSGTKIEDVEPGDVWLDLPDGQRKPAPPVDAKKEISMKVDCLSFMKKGTPFLKYGKRGYPHFRQFRLSEDNTKLLWFSQQKKTTESQIPLDGINEIKFGQTTANFKRHPASELNKSSFSIIYENGKKTVDLIAKDPNEYRIWISGLKSLMSICSDGESFRLKELKELVLPMSIRKGRRSSIDIREAGTGKTAEELGGGDHSRPRRSSASGDKSLHREVSTAYHELKRKYLKRKDELTGFKTHADYESMKSLLKKVEESIRRVSEWFSNGDYESCDDELWRASVDLVSLKHMMRAVSK